MAQIRIRGVVFVNWSKVTTIFSFKIKFDQDFGTLILLKFDFCT